MMARGGVLAISAIFLLGAAALVSARMPEAGAPRMSLPAALGDEAVPLLPRAARRLLADVSWLLAVQHYGKRRLADSPGFRRLRALVELSLRFDPELRPAAVGGSLLLAEPPPLGAGQARAADVLLSEWTARHPRDFEAILVRGLLRHWHLRDPAGAAAVLAAGVGGDAPAWFAALAARAWTEAGSRTEARALWQALLTRSSDPRVRANAATHLLQLDALDELDHLALLTKEFERRSGRAPAAWAELAAAGLLDRAPLDPTGTPFRLDAEGVPRIARDSPLAGHPGR